MQRRALCLIFMLASLASGPAAAGLLPPSVWQSSGRSSEAVLAFRGALEAALEGSSSRAALAAGERDAIMAFYEARGFAPLWIDASGPRAAAESLAAVLADAGSHALPAEKYAFALDMLRDLGAEADAAERARAEVALTAAALIYGRDASSGQVEPRSLSESITIDPVAVEPKDLLDRLASADDVGAVLEGLNPAAGDYGKLRAALVAMTEQARRGGWTAVPDGEALKPGMSRDRVRALRTRLIESGDLDPADGSPDSPVYDQALAAAVKAFQARHGLDADMVVGPGTLAALNVPIEARIGQIVANIERRRWLPDDLGRRHVFVNEADFRMVLVDGGEVVHEARVIVGKPKHQSPVFSDEIAYVEFNPYWNVPESIATEEYLPILYQDPTALARAGFETLDRATDQPVDATRIDWSSLDPEAFPYRFRQPPGSTNALGTIKFLFPNEHAVYMHDTPSRGLFSQRRRALSHGCVRVQNPLDFAEILLGPDGWSRRRIEEAIALGENQSITLRNKVPVHLAYWTSWVDETGRLHFRDDIYDRDLALIAALGISDHATKLADLSTH